MACAVLRSAWAVWTMGVAGVTGMLGLVVYSCVLWRRDPAKAPPAGALDPTAGGT